MLRQCQHKLAFSKTNWYTSALKAIIPHNEKNLLWKYQCRPTATMASVLKSVLNDNMPTTTSVIPPPVEPLQPIIYNKVIKKEEKTAVFTPKELYRRCTGFRRYDGHRCQRLVKTDPSLPNSDRILCFNHDPNRVKKSKKDNNSKKTCSNNYKEEVVSKEPTSVVKNKLFKAPSKVYDCWDLWIGKHIKAEQSNLMLQEMKKPISDRDKSGFIYVYSLSQGPRVSRNTYAYFKVGRTTNPHRRMYQISNVCQLEPEVIELFPSFPSAENQQTMSTNLETLDKSLDELPKCPLSHRVERLIHLELSSLYKRAGFKCTGCGSIHREWVRVDRRKHPDGRLMTDRELWLKYIRPIILKWVQYSVAASAVDKVSQ